MIHHHKDLMGCSSGNKQLHDREPHFQIQKLKAKIRSRPRCASARGTSAQSSCACPPSPPLSAAPSQRKCQQVAWGRAGKEKAFRTVLFMTPFTIKCHISIPWFLVPILIPHPQHDPKKTRLNNLHTMPFDIQTHLPPRGTHLCERRIP